MTAKTFDQNNGHAFHTKQQLRQTNLLKPEGPDDGYKALDLLGFFTCSPSTRIFYLGLTNKAGQVISVFHVR